MKRTADIVWNLLEQKCSELALSNSNFVFHSNKKDIFISRCEYWRNLLLTCFMRSDVSELDRHKLSAILVISIIESKAITYENLPTGKVFLGSQKLALVVGLSYMQHQLNKILRNKGEKTIEKYYMPQPWACKTKYLNVMARNLYYEEQSKDKSGNNLWRLNPLQLANTFYFIELYTLEKENIPTEILNEYDE